MSNVHNHSGAEPHDIGFIVGGLTAFNECFDRHTRTVKHAHKDGETALKWLGEVQGDMTLAAFWLEQKFQFIESGATFQELTESERILSRNSLIATFKNQQEFAALMEADFPDPSSAGLLAILDRLITTLEKQKKGEGSGLFLKSQGALRNLIQSGPRSRRASGKTIVERIASGEYKTH